MTDDRIVRIATKEDEKSVLSLCRQLAEENAIFSISEDKIREKLDMSFGRKGGICGVIGDIGNIKASIFLEISTYWYTDDFGLYELWNFVHPKHRRSRYAICLIDFAKECASKLHIPLQIGILSNQRTEAKIRLYRRKLGEPAGAFFLFNGHTGLSPASHTAQV